MNFAIIDIIICHDNNKKRMNWMIKVRPELTHGHLIDEEGRKAAPHRIILCSSAHAYFSWSLLQHYVNVI